MEDLLEDINTYTIVKKNSSISIEKKLNETIKNGMLRNTSLNWKCYDLVIYCFLSLMDSQKLMDSLSYTKLMYL